MNFLARSDDFAAPITPSTTAPSHKGSASKNAIPAGKRVDFWANRIRASMRKTFAGVLETGQILIRAKAALPHGQWLPMLAKAGLDKDAARMWMKVARNPRFANAGPDPLLPPCVTTLYQIGKLPDDVFQRLLVDGAIIASVTRETIKAIIRRLARKADEERTLELVYRPGKFRTLVIDPGWESGATQGSRACPYAPMTQEELLKLPVSEWLEKDAHVYLWATKAELRNAFALLDLWGVGFNELLVWNKTWFNGQPRLGLGQNFRHTCEFVLFGVRGKLRTRQASNTSFEAPVSGPHSEKPDEFYDIVRAASYPPFGEVFGRKPREGFVNLFEAVRDVTKAAA